MPARCVPGHAATAPASPCTAYLCQVVVLSRQDQRDRGRGRCTPDGRSNGVAQWRSGGIRGCRSRSPVQPLTAAVDGIDADTASLPERARKGAAPPSKMSIPPQPGSATPGRRRRKRRTEGSDEELEMAVPWPWPGTTTRQGAGPECPAPAAPRGRPSTTLPQLPLHHLPARVPRQPAHKLHHPRHLVVGHLPPGPRDQVVPRE